MKTKNKFWFDRYKHYRKVLNSLVTKSKKNHLRDFFQKHHQNLKKNSKIKLKLMKTFTSLTMETHFWTPTKLLVNLMPILLMFPKTFSKILEKQITSFKAI